MIQGMSYWMISNRSLPAKAPKTPADFGDDRGDLTFWTADTAPVTDATRWVRVTRAVFQKRLIAAAGAFRDIDPSAHNIEDQQHVTFFIHGYNNKWSEEAARYQGICDSFFTGASSLGECVMFDWPSLGNALGYLPDREHARDCANDLADVLSALYEYMRDQQIATAADASNACKAKISILAHSMGNYLLQKSMAVVWTRKNQPLLMSLVNQLLMIAADVDNDLFKSGETVQQSDGDAIANLTYRVTALYSGKDPVLGLSAGLKHFGKRRLGRSGIDHDFPVSDNVWDIDCSRFFTSDTVKNYPQGVHSAYFEEPDTVKLIRELLRGVDRTVLVNEGLAPAPLAKAQFV
jgi:esterase/lipase superfamily enzyme